MKATNGKIIVRVDDNQKNTIEVGDITMSTANLWETNYRYKSPTIAQVVSGNKFVKTGDILVCHHNLFYLPSPFHIGEDLFSIPFSKILFAKVDAEGNLDPICGNLLCNEIEVETPFPVPPEQKTFHKNRYVVTNPGWCKDYKVGDIIFTRPSSGYTIIYNWDGKERSMVKVDSEMICGVLNKKHNFNAK